MRYEHIEMDISTVACHTLMKILEPHAAFYFSEQPTGSAAELMNLYNELRARLQRRDVDPHAKRPDNLDLV